MSNEFDKAEGEIISLQCTGPFEIRGSNPYGGVPVGTSLELTLQNRGRQHGEYGVQATVAQRIKEAMGLRGHLTAAQRESLDMIATKISRIVCGDPNNRDHWHDIQGYAKLVEDRIPTATP